MQKNDKTEQMLGNFRVSGRDKPMDWHGITAQDAAKLLKSNINNGLDEQAAKILLKNHGENKLQDRKKASIVKQFFGQFSDFCVIILFIACIISFVTSILDGSRDFIEPAVILLIVILNAVIGVFQERRAERALEALKKLSAPSANVKRNGKMKKIPASGLVPGDVIYLESGDMVPADARLISSNGLKVSESALTGESEACEKDANSVLPADCPPADRKNMIFSSTNVLAGNCTAIVTQTGMETQVGKIAHLLASEKSPQTPLQLRLEKIGKALAVGALIICAAVFLLGVIRRSGILSSFMLSVSLAVAAIPEGLPAIVTIVLSMGVQIMAKNNAIIRHLPAVETLGAATVICSDKTGTLTQNKMTVTKVCSASGELSMNSSEACKILLYGSICNNSHVIKRGKKPIFGGDPTETAFACGENVFSLDSDYPRLHETPFSSEKKFMSTLNTVGDKKLLIVKGAPEVILPRCSKAEAHSSDSALTKVLSSKISEQNSRMAAQGLRVIAVAFRAASDPSDYDEKNLTFAGLIGMTDPPRPEAAKAVATCKKAGIIPVMITGDHIDTACAIAEQLGILESGLTAMTGAELDSLSDSELCDKIEKCRVFARVSPEHKVRIVKAFRSCGEIVAMTGDGVNDAPALKAADIGCAMGKSGTDVAKNAADMILTDDNFATIVGAVEEGRRIYDNIRKAIQFLLSSNMSEVMSIFIATLCGFVILEPVHLLWINLVTDCFPALALGLESAEPDVMRRKPRPTTDGVFAGGVGVDVAYQGFVVTLLTLAAYFIGHFMEAGVWEIANSADGMTMAFLTMSMAEIFHSLNMRSQRGSIFTLKTQNKALLLAALASLVLTTAVLYVPFLSDAFGFEHISLAEYGVAMALAVCMIPIVELVKLCQRKRAKAKQNV